MLCSFYMASMAQQPPLSRCNANNINATILGDGSCFAKLAIINPSNCPTWEVPAGSGKETVFQHALWFSRRTIQL